MFGRDGGLPASVQVQYEPKEHNHGCHVRVSFDTLMKPCEDVRETIRGEQGDGRAKLTCVPLVSRVIMRTICDNKILRLITKKIRYEHAAFFMSSSILPVATPNRGSL